MITKIDESMCEKIDRIGMKLSYLTFLDHES